MLGIDGEGLDHMDRKILSMIIDKFGGGPVGLGTIGTALGEEPDTLEEVYEPYLIRKGLLASAKPHFNESNQMSPELNPSDSSSHVSVLWTDKRLL